VSAQGECVGGPLDGASVPWTEPVVCAYYSARGQFPERRLAVYRRREGGRYEFEKLVREDDLRPAE
jgi:hypothetical protein